jgi:hypothetical protein
VLNIGKDILKVDHNFILDNTFTQEMLRIKIWDGNLDIGLPI